MAEPEKPFCNRCGGLGYMAEAWLDREQWIPCPDCAKDEKGVSRLYTRLQEKRNG